MTTFVQSVNIDLTVVGRVYGPFDMREFDDLYYRFERTVDGGSSLSGVLEFGESLTPTDEPHGWTNATMTDNSKHDLDVEDVAFVTIRVKTAQSGYTGTLHLYARKRAPV